jgi:hypothetical protein
MRETLTYGLTRGTEKQGDGVLALDTHLKGEKPSRLT